jgi:hypothetical protein
MSNCVPVSGVSNGVSGSNSFSDIEPQVVTNFAVMYNYYDEYLLTNSDSQFLTPELNSVVLNTYGVNPLDASNCDASGNMSMQKFLNLFYPTNSGFFSINATNAANPAVILTSQTYTSSNSNTIKFSLFQYLLKAYCGNKGISYNDIDPRIIMLLHKETFVYQSLATVKGTTIALSWDELINTLIRSGLMDPSGSITNSKNVVTPLSLVFKYHSFVLDMDLSITFKYSVNLTGYVLPSTPAAQQTYNCQTTQPTSS